MVQVAGKLEGWPSGKGSGPENRLGATPCEFESHPFRQMEAWQGPVECSRSLTCRPV